MEEVFEQTLVQPCIFRHFTKCGAGSPVISLVLVSFLRLLLLYSFLRFHSYVVYFTFIKSVAKNKDLSQPFKVHCMDFGPGGALPYKPTRDVPFFRVSFFSINS